MAFRTWHPDSLPQEEAPTRSWWPLNSHQDKEILMVKCFQSHGAGARSLPRSYQKDLPPSAYQDGTRSLSVIRTWTVFHSWPYRGKVLHYVIRQVQPGPSSTSMLSGAEISASDARDSEETTCWDLNLESVQPDFMIERIKPSTKTTYTQGISLAIACSKYEVTLSLIFLIWFKDFWTLTGQGPQTKVRVKFRNFVYWCLRTSKSLR